MPDRRNKHPKRTPIPAKKDDDDLRNFVEGTIRGYAVQGFDRFLVRITKKIKDGVFPVGVKHDPTLEVKIEIVDFVDGEVDILVGKSSKQ